MIRQMLKLSGCRKCFCYTYLICSAFMVGCGDTERDNRIAYHIAKLEAGDFATRPTGEMTVPELWRCEPYHVKQLIQYGPEAGPAVFELLYNDTQTSFTYFDKLNFEVSHFVSQNDNGSLREHPATLGDIGNYILESIYNTDVGYRSHTMLRKMYAIEHWRQTIWSK